MVSAHNAGTGESFLCPAQQAERKGMQHPVHGIAEEVAEINHAYDPMDGLDGLRGVGFLEPLRHFRLVGKASALAPRRGKRHQAMQEFRCYYASLAIHVNTIPDLNRENKRNGCPIFPKYS